MKCCDLLLLLVFILVVFFGFYLCKSSGNESLKVIIPLSCLILALVICSVVNCKNNSDSNKENSYASVVIIEAEDESIIPEDEKKEAIKAYIVRPKGE